MFYFCPFLTLVQTVEQRIYQRIDPGRNS